MSRKGLRRATSGALIAATAVVAVILPASASAALVEPHSAIHTITPRAATGSGSTSSPAPVVPAPQSVGPSSSGSGSYSASDSNSGTDSEPGTNPGPTYPDPDSSHVDPSPPYPTGPQHWDPRCDLSCKETWSEFVWDTWNKVWVGNLADSALGARHIFREFKDLSEEIEREIAADREKAIRDSVDAVSGADRAALGAQPSTTPGASAASQETEGPLDTVFNAIVQAVCPKGDYQSVNYQVEQGGSGTNACF